MKEKKLEIILNEYKGRKISIGQAAELAGVSLWEFIEHCRKNHISLDFTKEDAEMGINFVKKQNIREYKKELEKTLKSLENNVE
ncbi:MAG: UPF0175 family protein [Promethearchaeota archaeon]